MPAERPVSKNPALAVVLAAAAAGGVDGGGWMLGRAGRGNGEGAWGLEAGKQNLAKMHGASTQAYHKRNFEICNKGQARLTTTVPKQLSERAL